MMPLAIVVRDRGATPRNMRRIYNAAAKAAYDDTGWEFHRNYREKRFTPEHALEAGYARRKGELIARGTKAFRRSYTGRKLSLKGHTNPLEFSGDTKRAVRYASVSATSRGVKVRYRGAARFNFRPPKSRIRMSEEFRRITEREAIDLGQFFDRRLDLRLAEADKGAS